MDIGQLWVDLGVNLAGLNTAFAAITKLQVHSEAAMGKMTAATNAAAGAQTAAFEKASMAQIAASNKATALMANNINRTSLAFTRFGQSMTMYATVPLALIGGAAIKLTMDLEKAKQKIVALAGVSQEQMNAWGSDIERIGNLTNRSSVEIVNSLYFITSNGIRSAAAIEMVEAAAKGAAAGMGEAEEIAKVLTYAYVAYGKEAFSVTKTMDAMSVAVREGALETKDMVGVLGKVIPVAQEMGVRFDQVVASISSMSRIGLTAANSAVYLRQIMMSLMKIKPGDAATSALSRVSKDMKDATISAEGFKKQIRDGDFLGVLEKIKKISSNYKGGTLLTSIFGNVRSLVGELVLTGKEIENIRNTFNLTKNEIGFFETVFGTMTNTMAFKLDAVKRSAQNFLLSAGKALYQPVLDMFKSLSATLNDLANWFKNLTPAAQQTYIQFAKYLLISGPIISFLGNMIRVLGGIGIAYKKLKDIMAASSILTFTNPWIALGAILVAVSGWVLLTSESTDKLTVAQEKLNREVALSDAAITRESTNLKNLMSIANNGVSSYKAKEEAVKKLNTLSPGYLGWITVETSGTQAAKEAVDAYTASLIRLGNQKVEAPKSYWKEVAAEWADFWFVIKTQQLSLGETLEIIASKGRIGGSPGGRGDQLIAEARNTERIINMLNSASPTGKENVDWVSDWLRDLTRFNIEAKKTPLLLSNIGIMVRDKGTMPVPTNPKDLPPDGKNPYQEAIDNLRKGEKYIAFMASQTGALGDSFNKTSESTSLFNGSLKTFFELAGKNDPYVKRLAADIEKLMSPEVLTAGTMEELSKTLAKLQIQVFNTNGAFDSTPDALNAMTSALKTVSENGTKGGAYVDYLRTSITVLTETNSMKTLQKSLADVAMQSAFMGGSFDALGAKLNAHRTRLSDLIKEYQEAKRVSDTVLMGVKELQIGEENSAISLLNLNDITKAHIDALSDLNTKQNQSGISLGSLDEKIKIEQDNINRLVTYLRVEVLTTEEAARAQGLLNMAYADVSVLQAIKGVRDYDQAMSDIKQRHGIQGMDASAWIQDRVNAEKAIKAITESRSGMTAGSPEWSQATNQIRAFTKEAEKADKMAKFETLMGGISEGLSSLQPLMGAYTSLLDAQQNRALATIQRVAKERHKSEAWVTAQNLKVNEEYAKKKKQMAIAEAVVNTAVSVTKAMAQLGWWSWIQIPLLLAAGAMQVAAIQAQPMAEGGIVPGGYRNDTYPALLTSGEMVVPPGKLNSIQSDTSKRSGRVVFEIEGRKLVGILEDMSVLNNSF